MPARLRGGAVDPQGDHRIAMMGAIAARSRRTACGSSTRRASPCRSPTSPRSSTRCADVAERDDGDHHRRSRGRRQVDGRAGARARIGYRYLDTGAMYRAVTLAVLCDGGEPGAVATRRRLARARRRPGDLRPPRSTRPCPRPRRCPACASRCAPRSASSSPRATRSAEGRDIGEVVWPQAELKVWLDATPGNAPGAAATPPR